MECHKTVMAAQYQYYFIAFGLTISYALFLQMSWTDMLRTKFCKMRRPPKLHAMGSKPSGSKPAKHLKIDTGNHYVCLDLSVSSIDKNKTIFERNKITIRLRAQTRHHRQLNFWWSSCRFWLCAMSGLRKNSLSSKRY